MFDLLRSTTVPVTWLRCTVLVQVPPQEGHQMPMPSSSARLRPLGRPEASVLGRLADEHLPCSWGVPWASLWA